MLPAKRVEILQSDGEEAHGVCEAMPLIPAWKNGFCLETMQNLAPLIGIDYINKDSSHF